jgi:acetoin utilization deacetylase AcuC-like enzyme
MYSHGNGTQKIFYDNPNVLYISVHRWEHGKFYPFSGAPDECGQSEGLGFNVNIALNESKEKPSKKRKQNEQEACDDI